MLGLPRHRSPSRPEAAAGMRIGKLIEVGVAVSNLAAASRTFAERLGTPVTKSIGVPMFSMDFRMCRLGYVDFELMAPRGQDGVIRRFLSRRSEGLHHIAFQVSDLSATIAECRARGLPILSDEPVLLGELRAAFLHPACISGLLIEFVEKLHGWHEELPLPGQKPAQQAGSIAGFGIAVADVDKAAAEYAEVLGAGISELRWNGLLGTHVRHASVADLTFELLPSAASLLDAVSLGSDLQGLHHVSLEVEEPEAFIDIRRPSGKATENAETGDAFFTEPSACHGVMFEIRAGRRPVTA